MTHLKKKRNLAPKGRELLKDSVLNNLSADAGSISQNLASEFLSHRILRSSDRGVTPCFLPDLKTELAFSSISENQNIDKNSGLSQN
jgi:hypothetical protein